MKRITVALTGDSGEKLEQLLAQTGMNTNRLMNALISNAVVSDVVKREREPVSAVAASVDFERVSAKSFDMRPNGSTADPTNFHLIQRNDGYRYRTGEMAETE